MALEINESHPSVKIHRFEEEVVRTQIDNKWQSRAPISCTSDVLEALTDNFKEENFIGPTTFGKVYRGKLKLDPIGAETRDVTVKIWDDNVDVIDDGKVTEEEVKFLSNPNVNYHPNLAKLIGYCSNGYCSEGPVNGVVYELNPLDSLYNHTAKGIKRIWSDVFSYGLILLGLIAKRVDLKEDLVKYMYKTLDEWAYEAYKPHCSLVHDSLTKDKDYDEFDAIALTELAMRCIKADNPKECPTMSQVVNCLKKLRAFQVLKENAHRDKRMKFGGVEHRSSRSVSSMALKRVVLGSRLLTLVILTSITMRKPWIACKIELIMLSVFACDLKHM
ncbi:hypothetical protein LguiA_030218 [Lonicera macranthoides]